MIHSKLQHYVIICDKSQKDTFISLMTAHGAVGVETIYGRGSAKGGSFAQALGLEIEEHKVVLSALMALPKAEELTELLKTKYRFQSDNTGIAFSIPVEGLSL